MNNVIKEFRERELSNGAGPIILKEIQKSAQTGILEIVLNTYNLYINFDKELVTLDDDLDPSDSGSTELSLNEFLSLIK